MRQILNYKKIMIKVSEQHRSLIGQILILVQSVMMSYKKEGFQRIKRRMLRTQLKRLHKSNFQSVKSSSDSSSTSNMLSNYVSITDFKPLEANYSSIRIIDYETHGVKKDLTSLVAKKISYTSTQLLNKDTFLQNWMVRLPLLDLKPEKYPLSDYSNKKIISYNQDALNSVRKFTFDQYVKINVKKKNGFFSLTESDPMKYKKNCISSSLTHMKESQNQIAIEAFEILLKAGGEGQSKYNYLYQISQLIDLMVKGNDNIKQEIFLQIIKQISSHKEIYMRIFCCVSYCVKPSSRIYIPLLNFLYEDYTMYETLPKELLNYSFFHLIRNFDKDRKSTPCLFELFCAFHGAKIPIVISFPKEKVFFIQMYTTVEEFMLELIEYYNLDSHIEYLLEINGFLMEKGNLLDNLNYYSEVDEEDFKWKDYQAFKALTAIIVLKNVNDITVSPRCHSIMYNYTSNQYIRGLYSLRSTDIVKIAALKMQSEIQDQEQYIFEYENLISKRKLRVLTKEQKEKYRKHILNQYFKLGVKNKAEARREILEILSKSKGYNTHFFKAQIFVEEFDQFPAWVGVKTDKFLIVEPSTGRIMRTIAFNKIKEWGKSKSQLCLRIDGQGQFHIDSRQVDILASVFENYINYYSQIIRN